MFGYGNQPTNGFGAPPAPFSFGNDQPNTGFPPPFGSSQPPTPAAAAGFGVSNSSNTNAAPMFGSSPNVNIMPPVGGGGGGSTGFGSSATVPVAATAFGTSFAASAPTLFGGQPSSLSAPMFSSGSTGFGTSSNIVTATTPAFNNMTGSSVPFGGTNNSPMPQPFGYPPTQTSSQPLASSGPFGSATNSHFPNNPFTSNIQPPDSTPQFALSSNVVSRPWPGSSTATTPSPASGVSPFGSSHSAFPPSSITTAPFGGYDDGMMDDAPPPSNLVFGRPVTSAPEATTKTSGAATEKDDSNTPQANNEELLTLQAKIQAKKKKLALQKQLREAAAAGTASTLRPEASPFAPSKISSGPSSESTAAQRNAVRFSESADPTTRSHLPHDLVSQSAEVTAAQTALRNSGGRSGRENLEHAVSLVGTCEHMCPDEELLRREREGDVQLLERCAPGVLHPHSWTLRNTMVKRFRRSAADYKLDVPEWIRPPDVLEKVCGYLEEWVMERDRQGDDPRYKAPPPPLDVYQYVWDRTRMVRKDFILQNYVGNGGKCDARAVRCHERIARWHTLCEHQLSHLSDFVVMQSQQNVQELGQTMKTLNQFYDDSMDRALVEVPDDDGRETRFDLSGTEHGCQFATVQGPAPIDYDGSSLDNTVDREETRLTGKHAVHMPNHGTAEPEMRGLYILLTMGNDGGMEVLKYAARLYQERPEVYHTTPVQLALAIFKAKTDMNYAQFFSILRSSTTPYLFACLMFKHVEVMRKLAFRICSKTYGSHGKDGVAMYDTYPLERLTVLLCFESDDEARLACRHYHITVVDDAAAGPFVRWKASSYREPKDDDKGTAIPLRPLKMLRTIESKLKGATRVAICRGEVSGEGSCLAGPQLQFRLDRGKNLTTSKDAAREALLAQRERVEANRKREEQRRRELEEVKQAEREKANRETERVRIQVRMEQERQQKELEKVEKERLESERQLQQIALEKAAARKRAEDEEHLRRVEVERQELLRRERDARIREQEERKRLEEELLAIQAAEAERKKQEHEAEQRRKAEERERKEFLRQENLKRQLQEAEERQRRQEQIKRVDTAKRTLLWRRMLYKTVRIENSFCTQTSLESLSTMRIYHNLSPLHITKKRNIDVAIKSANRLDMRQSLEAFLQESNDQHLKINEEVAKGLRIGLEGVYPPLLLPGMMIKTCLFKVAIILPGPSDSYEQCVCGLVQSWIRTQFDLMQVAASASDFLDARVTFIFNTEPSSLIECDAALLVLPPQWSDHFFARLDDVAALSRLIDESVPRVVLLLAENFDCEMSIRRSEALFTALAGKFEKLSVVGNDDLNVLSLNQKLKTCIAHLVEAMVGENPRQVERWSMSRVYFECFEAVMRYGGVHERKEDVIELTQTAIRLVISDIEATYELIQQSGHAWPPIEFGKMDKNECAVVPDYFGKGVNLPMDWITASRNHFGPICHTMFDGSFSEIVERLISDASLAVQSKCQRLFDEGYNNECMRTALRWRVHADEMVSTCKFIFLPIGQFRLTFDRAYPHVELSFSHTNVEKDDWLGVENDHSFIEQIDAPPEQSTPGKRASSSTGAPHYIPEEGHYLHASPKQSKRQRLIARSERKRTMSRHLLESEAFTKKLERLCRGDEIIDMMLGHGASLLSDALRDAPGLDVKEDNYRYK